MRKLKKIQFFPVIAVSFLLLGVSTYFHYNNLAEFDFAPADLSFENPDQDNRSIDHLNGLKIFGSDGLFGVLLLINDILERPPLFFLQRSSLDPKILPLRC